MDIVKVEKSSSSVGICNNIRGLESFSRSKVSSRSTSTIGFVNSHQMENPSVKRNQNLVLDESNDSCICSILHILIRLICMALFTCIIGMFIFTLIFYAFDIYWLEQPIINNSSSWFDENNNQSNIQ
ncbi:unnamed protein product [Rotaria sp. Silwood1]|nr:unnamed protein product [Rotaria sp. Silwood1]